MAKISRTKKSRNTNGFTKTPNIIFYDERLNIYDRMVLIVLKKYQFNNDYCFPSIPLISQEAGCSGATVIRSLGKLRSLGYVSWYRTGRHNVYKPDWQNE